jgi:hypothetical protein
MANIGRDLQHLAPYGRVSQFLSLKPSLFGQFTQNCPVEGLRATQQSLSSSDCHKPPVRPLGESQPRERAWRKRDGVFYGKRYSVYCTGHRGTATIPSDITCADPDQRH